MGRFAIAGAGIAGLAAATGLAQAGHDVVVFDQWEAPRPVGSGLVVQPVGLSVLDVLGSGGAARALGQPISRMYGTEALGGRVILDVTYDPAGRGREGLAMHRAALHGVLLDAARGAGARFDLGAPVTGREGTRLRVNERLTEAFDLVIDAAGAASPLSPLAARPLPYGAIWGVVEWPATDLPSDRLSQRYRRADRMIGVLPIGRAETGGPALAAVFWSLPRDGHAGWLARPLDDWRAEASMLWPEARPFLDLITDHDQMVMARYGHGQLRRPFADGIVHLGDAAHRASPQLGQGANMALLDALALVRAVEAGPLGEAGHRMWNARRAHVRAYQTMSAAFTPQYQSDSRALPWLRDRVLAPVSQAQPAKAILPALVRGTMMPPLGAGLGPIGAASFVD
ncbi:FAD-dependent oxidoreductase [Jannaschia aquimarina]|uniref:HpxO protein n=1 Tax=Jannaschia aquimarina TaxID=935700 RepID=A0A0D1D338_9RHOB|nr:NAD(P)/FAD-dependent oxidoreductase [Jannaschia aquimarina]KIT14533.1 FAD-dependent urate hydroxylase [Jannaschia aquimarina]SNT35590.1 2-polyprenyl-6-methoxyphenol hydroxylase [Jannaschia aquimarina]